MRGKRFIVMEATHSTTLTSRPLQSFGEVNQITRIANGDLHVDFKSAEVAETVCFFFPCAQSGASVSLRVARH